MSVIVQLFRSICLTNVLLLNDGFGLATRWGIRSGVMVIVLVYHSRGRLWEKLRISTTR